jgi:hypothetical protein
MATNNAPANPYYLKAFAALLLPAYALSRVDEWLGNNAVNEVT